jgi:hypothetical protein
MPIHLFTDKLVKITPNFEQTSLKVCFPIAKPSIPTDPLLLLLLVVVVVVVGHAVGLQTGRSRVRFSMVLLEFFIYTILPAALWRWVDSASNRNDYQEYFWG